jgi:hypothetical protein
MNRPASSSAEDSVCDGSYKYPETPNQATLGHDRFTGRRLEVRGVLASESIRRKEDSW